MVDGIKSGAAPKAVTTMMEEEARRTFEAGRSTYQRQWPGVYALGNEKGSKIKDKFEVVPFPEFEGGGKSGILGGGNMVISVYSKNPGGALTFADFTTSAEMQKQGATEFSDPPVLTETYEDPDVKKNVPFASELKQAVEQAQPRPVSPVYTQISQAIYKNVSNALAGQTDPKAALAKAQSDIDKALATF